MSVTASLLWFGATALIHAKMPAPLFPFDSTLPDVNTARQQMTP